MGPWTLTLSAYGCIVGTDIVLDSTNITDDLKPNKIYLLHLSKHLSLSNELLYKTLGHWLPAQLIQPNDTTMVIWGDLFELSTVIVYVARLSILSTLTCIDITSYCQRQQTTSRYRETASINQSHKQQLDYYWFMSQSSTSARHKLQYGILSFILERGKDIFFHFAYSHSIVRSSTFPPSSRHHLFSRSTITKQK